MPVDPGVQVIQASARGRDRWTRRMHLSGEGRLWSIEVPRLVSGPVARKPLRDEAVPPPPLAYKDSRQDAGAGTTQRVWGGVAGALGVAALSAGGVLGFVADRKYEDSLDECRQSDPRLCTPTGVQERQEAQDYAVASAVALSSGGALLITGVVVYLTAPSAQMTRQYCATVMTSCTDDFAVYTSTDTCHAVCRALPEGIEGDEAGNSVYCRLRAAEAAPLEPPYYCPIAGPGGAGICGTNCESLCAIMETACSGENAQWDNPPSCMSECEAQHCPHAGGAPPCVVSP